MTNTNPNALELTGGPLRRYLEIRRLRHMIDPSGKMSSAWRARVDALARPDGPIFDSDAATPETLEAYARSILGDPGKASWLTRDQWEVVILFCHEHLNVNEAADRCKLSLAGLRHRWTRTKRRINRLPQIRAVVNTQRRELYLGV